MDIGKLFGYRVVEDDSVKELRLPKKVIDLLSSQEDFTESEEYGN